MLEILHLYSVHIAQGLHCISIYSFLEYLGLLSRVLICLSPLHYKSPNCKYDMSFLSPAHRTVHVRCTLALPKANCRSHNSSTEYSVRRMVFLFASNSCGIAEEAKLRQSWGKAEGEWCIMAHMQRNEQQARTLTCSRRSIGPESFLFSNWKPAQKSTKAIRSPRKAN